METKEKLESRYSVKLFQSKDLKGLTGDNGETFLVFVIVEGDPINSGWKWFDSSKAQEQFAEEMRLKLL